MTMPEATLKIFYGPPGSGKTFQVVREAVRIVEGGLPKKGGGTTSEDGKDVDQDKVNTRYRKLLNAGRIWFVTFHPNYSYEDFVEGFRPKELEGQIQYLVESGPFMRACEVCQARSPLFRKGEQFSGYEV